MSKLSKRQLKFNCFTITKYMYIFLLHVHVHVGLLAILPDVKMLLVTMIQRYLVHALASSPEYIYVPSTLYNV